MIPLIMNQMKMTKKKEVKIGLMELSVKLLIQLKF
jgi:hypothetical protein